MNRPYECPDCRNVHDEPSEAPHGIFVRCIDCELEMLYRVDRDGARAAGLEFVPRAA